MVSFCVFNKVGPMIQAIGQSDCQVMSITLKLESDSQKILWNSTILWHTHIPLPETWYVSQCITCNMVAVHII